MSEEENNEQTTPGEAPETGAPEGTTEGGTPEGGTPEGGTPEGGTPEGGTPEGGTPEGGTPEGGTPEGGTPEGAAPEGTTEPGALFDLMGTEKPKKPEKKAEPKATPGEGKGGSGNKKAQKKAEPAKYTEGTEVRYQRHSLTLPREMTAQDVIAWLAEDDFPELGFEDTELRYDKEKERLVPVRKAQKKGGCA